MATPRTVVAVYGVPSGQSRVQRLGSGMLASPEIVVVDPPLDGRLASKEPPRVLRVGLSSAGHDGTGHDEPFVELREVRQVFESVATRHGRFWGLGLTEPARSPTVFGPDGPRTRDDQGIDAEELADLLQEARPHLPDRPLPPRPPIPHSPPKPPHGHPATLWCRLFPHAWFCRQRV